MRTTLLFATFLLVACGGEQKPAEAPTTTSTPAAATAEPATDKASGADAKCGEVPKSTATALDACKADCEKLDEKAPEGSRCVPPRTQCKMNCDSQFKK